MLRDSNTRVDASSESTLLDATKRQFLKIAGVMGAGALLTGSASSAAAQDDGSEDESDSDSGDDYPPGHEKHGPWSDSDGDGLLETGFAGIDVNVVKSEPTDTSSNIGVVDKELMTQEDTTIHVHPDGDDDNDGSRDNPIATIQEAVNRIPLFVLHEFTIDIADGEYTDPKEGPAVHAGPFIVKGEADVNLYGNSDDPSKVYCDRGINWTGFGKLEHMRVHGISWNHLSQFAGQADVRNCIFRGNGAAAISGKNGHVFFKRCEIGDPENDDFAVWGIQLERMYFDECTIGATEYALNVFNGDIYQLSGQNTINAPETFTMSGGALATQGTDLYVGGAKISGEEPS